MANPQVLSVTPQPNATDIILGSTITVTFNSLMNSSSITPATFSVTGPAQSQILTATQLISSDPVVIQGRNTISGTLTTATNSSNQTVVTFTPNQSFQPNSQYTVLLVGSNALLVQHGAAIADLNGNPLLSNYKWSFGTGVLNTITPPPQSPIPYPFAQLNPNSIKVRVNGRNPGDFLNQDINGSYIVELIFPANIDQTSFSANDILVSLEQFLGDPTIPVPTGLTPTITIDNNIITITIQGS